jgi:hypothetical protein
VDVLPEELLVRQHEPIPYAQRISSLLSGRQPTMPVILPADFQSTRNAIRVCDLYKSLFGADR